MEAFFFLVLAATIALYLAASLWALSSDARFRLLTAATLLLYAVLGMALGWGTASVLWFSGLWVYAIFGGLGTASARHEN